MATLSALVSGLDAELRRLGYKDSTLVWYRGLLASLGEVLRCPSRREGPVRIDVLCAALDPRPRPHQVQQANAAHNPALLIGFAAVADLVEHHAG
jgi:hypothetical protein